MAADFLTGWVAVLTPKLDSVDHVENLGPVGTGVKPGRVLPLIDVVPELGLKETLGEEQFTIGSDSVTRTWAVNPAPPVTDDDISAERERRIALPLTVQTSAGTFPINMDPKAQRNLQGLASVGTFLKITGQTTPTTFRDFNDTSHSLTPDDLIGLGLQVAARIQAVYTKSWAIKALDPIPADFTEDGYWK